VKSDERACLSRVVVWLWERKKERVFEFVCLFVVHNTAHTHTRKHSQSLSLTQTAQKTHTSSTLVEKESLFVLISRRETHTLSKKQRLSLKKKEK
jgi:hypothetical protein